MALINYEIIWAATTADLQVKIQAKLDSGYILVGGVQIDSLGNKNGRCCQAVVKNTLL